jgi:hypothetical protein
MPLSVITPRPPSQSCGLLVRWCLYSLSEVALDCLAGLVAKRTRTGPTALAEDDSNIHIKIDVRNGQTRRLGHTHARVQEQADDGSVTAIVEPGRSWRQGGL